MEGLHRIIWKLLKKFVEQDQIYTGCSVANFTTGNVVKPLNKLKNNVHLMKILLKNFGLKIYN